MDAVFVVLTRVEDFLIIAVCMGWLPVAEHVILKFFNDRTTREGDCILGKAIKKITNTLWLRLTGQMS